MGQQDHPRSKRIEYNCNKLYLNIIIARYN